MKFWKLVLTCFQQHFYEWFSVLRYNLDLAKNHLNEQHHYLTSTKLVICQIHPNCSKFQSLNLCPFHIKLEPFKLMQCSLISNLSEYYFKIGKICLLYLTSHVSTALQFDSKLFAFLLLKIVKPHDHNKIKSPITEIFWKYKPTRHYFVRSRKYLPWLFINKV